MGGRFEAVDWVLFGFVVAINLLVGVYHGCVGASLPNVVIKRKNVFNDVAFLVIGYVSLVTVMGKGPFTHGIENAVIEFFVVMQELFDETSMTAILN